MTTALAMPSIASPEPPGLARRMLTGQDYVDGSWMLRVFLNTEDGVSEQEIRVKGNLHIGGLILQIVNTVDRNQNWSDYALWWPQENLWLLRTRSTLNQYGVSAETELVFTTMHKNLVVQLPDLQLYEFKVDFSAPLYRVVCRLCKDLSITHAVELSLQRQLDREGVKKLVIMQQEQTNTQTMRIKRAQQLQAATSSPSRVGGGIATLPTNPGYETIRTSAPATPSGNSLRPHQSLLTAPVAPFTPLTPYTRANGSYGDLSSDSVDGVLVHSPQVTPEEGVEKLFVPRDFADRTLQHACWLDSSRSLYEQGVVEGEVISLKYKFFTFFDISTERDAVRLNQIYETARWGVFCDEVSCTDEEMIMFAALQLQVRETSSERPSNHRDHVEEDEVDSALDRLGTSLDSPRLNTTQLDLEEVPEMKAELLFAQPKKFRLGAKWHSQLFHIRDTTVTIYQPQAASHDAPILRFSVKGCEVKPRVDLAAGKFTIHLFIPEADGMREYLVRCPTQRLYAQWMAAFRLAAKGRTMADVAYDGEVSGILQLFKIQNGTRPSTTPAPGPTSSAPDVRVPELFTQRWMKRAKNSRTLVARVTKALSSVRHMDNAQAKLQFIKAWQALPEFGLAYFLVRFADQKKEKQEMVGVAFNRIIKVDINTGAVQRTWRFANMREWRVNWDMKRVELEFDDGSVRFKCDSASCQVVHEMIGGYIFCSMRSKERAPPTEEVFYKLTGGHGDVL